MTLAWALNNYIFNCLCDFRDNAVHSEVISINIFCLPQLPLKEELVTVLTQHESVRIERIINTGQVSDWYDQDEAEFVVLLEGNAEIEYGNGETTAMVRGDTLMIKPHERHRVSRTSVEPPCVWLCVFWRDDR